MKIKPLTLKMKNRVREHGDDWYIVFRDERAGLICISPERHRGTYMPYMAWVKPGRDVDYGMEGKRG